MRGLEGTRACTSKTLYGTRWWYSGEHSCLPKTLYAPSTESSSWLLLKARPNTQALDKQQPFGAWGLLFFNFRGLVGSKSSGGAL